MNNQENSNEKAPLLIPPVSGQEQVEQDSRTGTGASTTPDTSGKDQVRDDSGRFKPGFSGNIIGRPPGIKQLTHRVREKLLMLEAKDEFGNPLPLEEALAQKIVKMAIEGDPKMIQLVWAYLDGRPPQNIDLTSKGERLAGTMLVTDEDDLRIEQLFGFRKLLPPKTEKVEPKENANDKRPTNGSSVPDQPGGNQIPQGEQRRGAYEGTA